nr:N-6 DNA methylase [Candidatus Sigynarchaeota archaeon]
MLELLFAIDSAVYIEFLRFVREEKMRDATFSWRINDGILHWSQMLAEMYDASHLTEGFFLRHAFLVLVSDAMLARVGMSVAGLDKPVVKPFIECFMWLDRVEKQKQAIISTIESLKFPEHDVFNKIYPLVVSYSTMHGSGEYYTPVALARMMIEEKYVPGMRAMDPSCGSGTFLIEMVNKILASEMPARDQVAAISSLTAVDKNPIAIFMTVVNLSLVLREIAGGTAFPRVILSDSLFPSEFTAIPRDQDLVIGNPPWIVLGGIENASYKESLKRLAIELDVYMGGKNASNLEIASLFIFKYLEHVNAGKWIFFILPNSIITGSQHDKVRAFHGFQAVHVWKFSKQPFKIHSISIACQKAGTQPAFDYKFVYTSVEVTDGVNGELAFVKAGDEIYEPYEMKLAKNKERVSSVGRLIPGSKMRRILPRGKSPYAKLFYKGAQVFPRTMFFVDVERTTIEDGREVVTIVPSSRVPPKKLGRWNFFPYERDRVEKSYLFKIAKSTFIVPFQLIEAIDAFLPYKIIDAGSMHRLVEETTLLPRARDHLDRLEVAFAAHLKPGAAHTRLTDIINYQNCLLNPRQMAPLKVAYNGGGSIVKGVLVEGQIIVDYSMFYVPVDDRDEGYYLLAYLNAPAVTESVKLIGSTGFHGSLRNIVKHPLDFPWPRFDRTNEDHLAISKLGRSIEACVRKLMASWSAGSIARDEDEATRMKMQNLVLGDGQIKEQLAILDDLVRHSIEREIKS